MCFNVDLLLKANEHDRVFVGGNPVNWIDPWGLTLDSPNRPPYKRDSNWIRYPNRSGEEMFHCGYQCFIENRECVDDSCVDDPLQEACYDECGNLVDGNHPYAKCQGTPDQYPQSDWYNHGVEDSGGIVAHGLESYQESNRHREDTRRYNELMGY